MELGRHGAFERAIPLFRRACKEMPGDPRPQLGLARALALHGDRNEAARVIEHVIESTAAHPAIIENAAGIYEESDELERALNLWIRLFDFPSLRTKAISNAARLCERTNQPDQARSYLDSIVVDRQMIQARLVEAALALRDRSYSAALSIYQEVIENTSATADQRDDAVRGFIYAADRLGDFQQAWGMASKWHAEQTKLHPKMPPLQLPGVDSLALSGYTPKPFCRKVILLTGFPRSGTTLAAKLVADQIGARVIDEPLITTNAVNKFNSRKGIDPSAVRDYYHWTLTQQIECLADCLLIDKNPAICTAIPTYLRFVPEAHVIWCQRDPRDILVSCFLSAFPLNPFTATYSQPELLAEQIKQVLSNSRRILEEMGDKAQTIVYEQAVRNEGGLPTSLVNSLGLFDSKTHSATPGADRFDRSPTFRDVQQPIRDDRINRWAHYYAFAPKAFDSLQACAKSFGYTNSLEPSGGE